MQILMSNSSEPTANDPVAASAVFTLFIADKSQIGYYEGMPNATTQIRYTSFNQKGLAFTHPHLHLTVIIKPLSISNFQ